MTGSGPAIDLGSECEAGRSFRAASQLAASAV